MTTRSLGHRIDGGDPAPELRPVRATFRAVVGTLIPEARALGETDWRELESIVQHSLKTRPASLSRRLRAFIRLIDWLPVPRYGRRFTALDETRRERVLSYLQDHRLRIVRIGFWGVRSLALVGYYGRTSAGGSIGYRPDALGWEATRR